LRATLGGQNLVVVTDRFRDGQLRGTGMEAFPERQDTEFDWFALDDAGEVAVFATAGLGLVPVQVRAASELHDAMGDRITVTGWGTPTVWDSYTRVGLFVYDWDDQRRCYARVGQPSRPIGKNLSAPLAAMALPRLRRSFRNSPCVAADEA